MYFSNSYTRYLSKFTGFILGVVQYGCISHCTLEYIGDFVVCTGPSMEPTIHTDDVVISEHISPRLQSVERGDIVIARSPQNPQQFICKRVTGLPGDKMMSGFTVSVVPRGHVWLEGDNRRNSSDSRIYGAVPQGLIRGRVVCRIWPPKNIKILSSRKPL